jgi:hypothetical protein
MIMDDDKILPTEGAWGTVDYAVRINGSRPAENDLEKLRKKDETNYRRLVTLLIRMAEVGKDNLSCDVFCKLEGKIYRLRRRPYCMGCFFLQKNCLITHVFPNKTGPRFISKEIKKASEIRAEYLRVESKERSRN